jgi:anti-sigma factor RsiW
VSTDIHSLAGAYVLDAVDDLERAAFERHLRECATCRSEVDELREASARLADGAWSVPPPSLRANVMTAVRSTRQLSPEQPLRATRRAVTRWRRLTAAAAAVVAVAGATYAVQDQRVRHERARAEAAQAAEARVQSVLSAPDLTVRQQVVDGGGRVTVAVSRLRDAGVILLAADAAPANGSTNCGQSGRRWRTPRAPWIRVSPRPSASSRASARPPTSASPWNRRADPARRRCRWSPISNSPEFPPIHDVFRSELRM